MKPRNLTSLLLATALASPITVSTAVAATYQWDGNGATTSYSGNGNWTDAKWDLVGIAPDVNDGTATPGAFGATTDTAQFTGGTTATVTLNSSVTVASLSLAAPSGSTSTVGINSDSSLHTLTTGSIPFGNYLNNHTLTLSTSNGGTMAVSNSGNLTLRAQSTLTLNSGVAYAQTGGVITIRNNDTYGSATVNVNTGASFTYSGNSNIILAGATGTTAGQDGSGFLKLSGGVFTTSKGFDNAGGTHGGGASANLVFSSGGTLKLSADITSLANVTSGNTPFNISVGSGGGVIDTNGFSTTLNKGISGAGGLTKAGEGTLTLSGTNTYVGATTVNAGTLSVSATNQFSDSAALLITTGATLELNYSGTDTVGNFRIDGNSQATGTWGRLGSIAELGATHESALITGDGLIDNTNTNAEYFWDGTGSAWTSASAWTLVAANPAENPTVVPGAASVAFFGADGLVDDQTIQLSGDRALASLTFTSPVAFNFTGGGTNSTLMVGASGITVNAGTYGTTFGSTDDGQQVALVVNGSQTWTNQAGFAPLTAVNDVDLNVATLTTAGSGGFIFSGALTGSGGLVKQGSGYLQLNGANTFIGDKTVSQGSVTVSGDQSASTGTWNLNAGTVNFASGSNVVVAGGKSVTLGNTVTYHTLNVSGTVENNGELRLQGASNVNLNSGGVWTQYGSLNLVPNWSYEDATLTVNSDGVFTYAGAGLISMNTSNGGGNADDKTFLKISGGTFTTGQGFRNSTVGGNGSANLIISGGGTLKLSADVATLATTADRPFNVQVGSGGGIVDTDGFTTTLDHGISGTGGLTKAGAGTLILTGANSYSGDTTVNGGSLSLAGANLADASSVTITSGAVLDLNFEGTDSVASLSINGSSLPTGVYSKSTHPDSITGTGTLTVTGSGFNSWALGLGLSGNANADFDHDGVTDAAEYVLGTNPKVATSSGITSQKSGDNLVFTFSRADASETSDVALWVEAGTTLAAWPQVFQIGNSTGNSTTGVEVTENGAAADTVVVTIPTSASAKLFARLKVVVTP